MVQAVQETNAVAGSGLAPGARKLSTTALRARFAARLSHLYGTEVPAYNQLVQTSQEVNERVLRREGADAERLGSIARVTAERHGAIRVGSAREMRQVRQIFAALGMFPCGFYDLRDAAPAPVPVISTAFRPLQRDELAANPFRVFTSMLVPEDRRFFDTDLERRLKRFIDARQLFPPELLALADRASDHGELPQPEADRFLDLAVASFALSPEPVDRAWYDELERISSVASDIGGVASTHINHLTPRVLDIDDLYTSMQAQGIEMIDQIQGPPRWSGPDVLLRQTSFRALAEPRRFRDADGSIATGDLRVRFGEVEARGIALTTSGRDLYEQLVGEVDARLRDSTDGSRQTVAQAVWSERMPTTERDLCVRGLGFFAYTQTTDDRIGALTVQQRDDARRAAGDADAATLVELGLLEPKPIVYEDFLPRSAAGIFASNLSSTGGRDTDQGGDGRDLGWMSDMLEHEVAVPEQVYAAESAYSLDAAVAALSGALN